MIRQIERVERRGPFEPSWESLRAYEVPEWFRDAKFGIFIHWGLYAVPAFGNEWYSRNMYLPGEPEFEHHRSTYGPQNEFGYKDFIPKFTAENFDADAWAAAFRGAGAQYIVPVAEHHDGFAMYRSRLNPWNAVEMGPMRDVIGELKKAAHERSLTFGLSTHRAEHWWFRNGGMTFDSDVRDGRWAGLYGPAKPQELAPDARFLEEWVAHTEELIDAYEPELLYFDWWIHRPAYRPYLPGLAAHYYNRLAEAGRGAVLTYKDGAFEPGTAVEDVERGASATLRPAPWQACTSLSRKSWCYIENQDYKQPHEVVATLVDTVAKNGSLLLNVGPKADGTIPEAEQALLAEIGAWLAVNGEAVYGTRPWSVYGEGPTKVAEGGFTEDKQNAYTAEDLRFTTRGGHLYAIALAAPKDGRVEIRSLGTDLTLHQKEITRIELLGHTRAFDPRPLEFERGRHALSVRLPDAWDDRLRRAAVPFPVLRITSA